MIRIAVSTPGLSAAERFALETLLDLSRLLTVEQGVGAGDVVELRVAGSAVTRSISEIRDRGWYLQPRDGAVEMPRGLLSLVAEIAGAVREQRTDASDRYGRVPSAENELVVNELEGDPVVNRIALALRRTVLAAAGRRPVALVVPWPEGKRWAMAMSHDLDVVAGWPVFSALRVAELLGKGELGRAMRVIWSAAGSIASDPVQNATRQILEVERRFGVRSTWFIITGTPTFGTRRAGDVTYSPEAPAVRRIVDAAMEAGHEVGLHGSFVTYVTADEFARQRDRLAAIARRPVSGVRQHFLRMRPGTSHRAMVAAGFQYDSTFGFADRNGFRLGVADVVQVWDDAQQCVLPMDEVPFLWMDRALSKYRDVEDPGKWIEDALMISTICSEVEGVWNGIWHPNLAGPLGYPGAPEAFARLVERLMSSSPWSATLGEVVAWRRARREARAVGITPGGEIRLRTQTAALALEDMAGRTVPVVRA